MQVLACCLLHDLGRAEDGIHCGEVAAFCVHPSYRGTGRGDSLLDYVEQIARQQVITPTPLLTHASTPISAHLCPASPQSLALPSPDLTLFAVWPA